MCPVSDTISLKNNLPPFMLNGKPPLFPVSHHGTVLTEPVKPYYAIVTAKLEHLKVILERGTVSSPGKQGKMVCALEYSSLGHPNRNWVR
jgi:hypothetical protein